MARPPSIPTPRLVLQDALETVSAIRDLRRRGNDPDLDFYPSSAVDDDDVDAAVEYLMKHTAVSRDALALEVPDRAKLIEYQHQRDTDNHARRLLALLQTGYRLAVPASTYGHHLGLPTRYAVYRRRTRMIAAHSSEPTPPVNPHIHRWLNSNRQELQAVAGGLVDYRDDLIALLAADRQREELANAIDEAGARLAARPSPTLARSIAYAVFLLSSFVADDTIDTEVQELLNRAARLRREFLTTQDLPDLD